MRPVHARAAIALVALVASGAAARADIDGDTLVATEHGLRLELPRGWRATEVTAYPGVVVWLARTTPRVTIVVTVDPVVGPCSDPLRFCSRAPGDAADVLRAQLVTAGFEVTTQSQGRAPELEYQVGTRFLRHAVVVVDDQVVSVILAADSASARAGQGRAFERMLQSIRALAPAPRRAGD
jgi:hypothetical protein